MFYREVCLYMNSGRKRNAMILELEKKIGYQFSDSSILFLALTHSSYANEMGLRKGENNERLEYLGDAVLELVTSEYVYEQYEDLSEGDLTKLRASIVCEPTLSICARTLDMGKYILLGKGEDSSGGRDRDSILSNTLEAIIGAIYLDGGFTNAKEFVHRFILDILKNKDLFFDSKTILQEIVQNKDNNLKICYKLISEEGPDHNKIFTTSVCIGNEEIGLGVGDRKSVV